MKKQKHKKILCYVVYQSIVIVKNKHATGNFHH